MYKRQGLGHRSVACIATPLNRDNPARLRRLEGLRDVFRESCPEGRFLVRTCTITPEQERGDLNIEHRTGYTLARRCLAERDITAFVAVNDMVAYGVLDAILESGARVPEDYSLCGFDNIYPCLLYTSQAEDPGPGLMQASGQRGVQHGAAQPGIVAEDHAPGGKMFGHGTAQGKGQLRGQGSGHLAADVIGLEAGKIGHGGSLKGPVRPVGRDVPVRGTQTGPSSGTAGGARGLPLRPPGMS